MNWSGLAQWVRERGTEKSTWVALAGMVTLAGGWALTPDQIERIAAGSTVVMGLLGVVLPEKK